MASWSALKHLGSKRTRKSVFVLICGIILATQFQNCTPVGDANGVGSLGSIDPTVNCAIVPAPTITGTPPTASLNGTVGLGVGSGTVLPSQFNIAYAVGYPNQQLNANCSMGNPLSGAGLNVNCNIQNNGQLRVSFSTDQGTECVSGTATVTLRIRDDVCRQTAVSNAVTVQLTVANTCPAQYTVTKDNSVAPELTAERMDQFGANVDISGNWAVVTALGDNQKATDAGAAFVYNWDGSNWVYKQKLIPAELGAVSELDAAAVSGNLIVLGAPHHGAVGAIWAYRYNGTSWVQSGGPVLPSLTNSASMTENFGYDVAIVGSKVLVGAPGYYHNDPTNFARAGAVFVFNDNGSSLSEVQVLSASNKAANDLFGSSVAGSGAAFAVGAPGGGKAYAYNSSTYAETILVSGLPSNSLFGVSVAASASRIVVGAPGAINTQNEGSGAIVAFEAPAWTRKETIYGDEDGIQYGLSVAASGNDVLVGAPTQSINNATRSGAAHLLRLNGSGNYAPYFIFRPRAAQQGFEDYFGESVALGNGFVVGGSRADDLADTDMGSAYFIRVP